MNNLQYDIYDSDFVCMYSYVNLDACIISYTELLQTNTNTGNKYFPVIRISTINYFGPGRSFVKYTGFFENNKLVFYHGCNRDYLVGSILSLCNELQIVPTKDLCICYERFTAMNNLNTREIPQPLLKSDSGKQLQQSLPKPVPVKKPQLKSAPSQQKPQSKETIESLLSNNIELLEKLNKPQSERLPDFFILDAKDEQKKQADRQRKLDFNRKRENEETDIRNNIADAQNNTSKSHESKLSENEDDSRTEEQITKENDTLMKELTKYYDTNKLVTTDLEKQENLIEKDMMRVVDIECELRDIDNQKKIKEERLEENKRIFRCSKRTYVKINNDINDPKKKFSTVESISPLFEAKYRVIKFMENKKLIDMESAFNDNIEVDGVEYAIYEMLLNAITQINQGLENIDKCEMDPLIQDYCDNNIKGKLIQIFEEFVEDTLEYYESSEYSVRTEKDIMDALNADDNKTNRLFKEDIIEKEDNESDGNESDDTY